jgi:hypothetical protein
VSDCRIQGLFKQSNPNRADHRHSKIVNKKCWVKGDWEDESIPRVEIEPGTYFENNIGMLFLLIFQQYEDNLGYFSLSVEDHGDNSETNMGHN